jgi:hypothetical protein
VRLNGRWIDNQPDNCHPTRVADARAAEKLKERLS